MSQSKTTDTGIGAPVTLDLSRQPAPGSLAGKNVLITGAARGIGAAAARAAGAAGATVILLDRHVQDLEQVYDAIEQAGGPQPAIYPMNLLGAQGDDYDALGERLSDAFGALHGLVHNAAELGKPSQIDHYKVDTWFRTMHINLNAPFLLTQTCMPLLRRADDAAVVCVSDAVGRRGKAYQGAYGVSKFGLEGLMQILAAEVAGTTAIRVYSLDPGATHTGLRRQAFPAEDVSHLRQPDQVAAPLAYLLSSEHEVPHGACVSLE